MQEKDEKNPLHIKANTCFKHKKVNKLIEKIQKKQCKARKNSQETTRKPQNEFWKKTTKQHINIKTKQKYSVIDFINIKKAFDKLERNLIRNNQ